MCSRCILIFCWICVLEIYYIFDPDYCEAVPERWISVLLLWTQISNVLLQCHVKEFNSWAEDQSRSRCDSFRCYHPYQDNSQSSPQTISCVVCTVFTWVQRVSLLMHTAFKGHINLNCLTLHWSRRAVLTRALLPVCL